MIPELTTHDVKLSLDAAVVKVSLAELEELLQKQTWYGYTCPLCAARFWAKAESLVRFVPRIEVLKLWIRLAPATLPLPRRTGA